MNAKQLVSLIAPTLAILFAGCPALSKATIEYAWLLNSTGTEFLDEQNFKRFKMLVKAVAPDTKVFLLEKESLSRELFGDLLLPNDIVIREKRFITLTGAQPHFATQRGLVWIDAQMNQSVIAVYTSYWQGKLSDNLCIASKSFKHPDELPIEFWTDFKKWSYLNRGDAIVSGYNFVDAEGAVRVESLPVKSD